MITKSYATSDINPVSRVAPVLAVKEVANAAQELDFRALQFVQGQEYLARITGRADANLSYVQVDGKMLKMDLSKMDLGQGLAVGQQILLKYLDHEPVPTFALLQKQAADVNSPELNLSPVARQISNLLQQAEAQHAATRHVAGVVVSQDPSKPNILAQDLQQAIGHSGLFYESHLAEAVEGVRSFSSLALEPQNQQAPQSQVASLIPSHHLVAQQLAMLDSQHLSWQGEIWPGQIMDWDVQLPDQTPQHTAAEAEELPVNSVMQLHLPNLGNIKASIQLVQGHLRINIQAEQPDTLNTLRAQSRQLANNMQRTGQQLEQLLLSQYE
jgi:Flagellar hook-length control protein FliK